MDEEEELENTLIGQEEEAPAVNTGDVMMGGLGLGGAAFAAQTGRAPTPTPQGSLSPLAQQVAANDAARQAAARAASSASQPLGNLPRIGTLNPATGPSGGTTLPSQPSLQEARQAAARSAGVNPLSTSRLARFGGPGSLIYGAADLATELATGRGISERIGEGVGGSVGNLLFPGAQSQPAFTEAETLQDLAAMSSSEIQTPSVAPSNALLEMLERADEREAQGLPRQAAPGIIDAPVEILTPELDPTSDESILARRAAREAEFLNAQPTAPRSDLFPNDPGVQRTRDELMRRFGAPTIREIQEQDAMRRFGGGATPAPAQPSASALSDFERESIARQIRSGGTGSFAGDSAALQARIAERDRLPGETQTERDTRIAQSRTQRSSRGGLSQADARDLAQGMARDATEGERVRALQIQSRLGLDQFEPERELTDLEKREIESQIRAREAGIAVQERKADFQPRLIDVGGERAMELSPGYFQRIPKDTPEKTGLQKTLENLQSDLDSGRLTQEEYDIATKNAIDLYIGREKPKGQTTEDEFQNIIAGAEAGGVPKVDATDAPQVATGRGQARRGRPVETDGSTPPSPVRVNSPAEYDALSIGTPYIDSQGTEAVKK